MEIPNTFDFTESESFDKDFVRGDIMDYFPGGESPRDSQVKILKEYEELSKSYDKIIISDPVGGGKSFTARTIAGYFQPSFMVTTTLGLQNQYLKQFSTIGDLRGKNNFKCQYLMDSKPPEFIETLHTLKDFKRNRLTADFEPCSKKIHGVDTPCKYKNPSIDSEYYEKSCKYQIHKRAGLNNPKTVTNYALFFLYNMLGIQGTKRNCVIFDEAHTLEDNIINFVGVSITHEIMQDCGVTSTSYDFTYVDGVIKFLYDLRESYHYIIESKQNNNKSYPDLNLEKIKKIHQKLSMSYENLVEDPDNFVFYMKEKNLIIKPLNLTKHIQRHLTADKQVFLSGTIDKKYFPKMIGINPDEFGLIEIKKSPFSIDARKTKFPNVASMSSNNCTKQDQENMYKEINNILSKHKDERGLIHTSSKVRCHNIMEYISKTENNNRITEIHSENINGLTIQEILAKHEETPGSVLISSSMWTGYDFRDDLARFQIIEKFPRASWGDLWIKKKTFHDRFWYDYKTIVKTLQGMGRIVRSTDDWGITYCLDSDIQSSFRRNKDMIPEAFWDVIFPNEEVGE